MHTIKPFEYITLLTVVTLSLSLPLDSSALTIDFDTKQDGTPYTGSTDTFLSNEYDGVLIFNSDTGPTNYVNLTNPANVETDISGYYVNVGANAGVTTQLTIDFTKPITHTHFAVDVASPAPVNFFIYDIDEQLLVSGTTILPGDTFISGSGAVFGAWHVTIAAGYYTDRLIGKVVLKPSNDGGLQSVLIVDNLEFSVPPIIDATATVADDAVIGDGSTVGPNAVIKKGVSLGEDSTIGPDVTIDKETQLGNNTEIGGGSTIQKNVIAGDDLTIGSNVIIHNDVLIGAGVTIGDNTEIHSGTVIGNNVSIGLIGGGSGVFIGNNVTIPSNRTIVDGDVIPNDTVVP